MPESWVQSLGQEILWRRERLPSPVFFAWRIPWTEERDRLLSMRLQRVRHDWGTFIRKPRLVYSLSNFSLCTPCCCCCVYSYPVHLLTCSCSFLSIQINPPYASSFCSMSSSSRKPPGMSLYLLCEYLPFHLGVQEPWLSSPHTWLLLYFLGSLLSGLLRLKGTHSSAWLLGLTSQSTGGPVLKSQATSWERDHLKDCPVWAIRMLQALQGQGTFPVHLWIPDPGTHRNSASSFLFSCLSPLILPAFAGIVTMQRPEDA